MGLELNKARQTLGKFGSLYAETLMDWEWIDTPTGRSYNMDWGCKNMKIKYRTKSHVRITELWKQVLNWKKFSSKLTKVK